MTPFDLDKALKGAKVITREGREVTQLHLFDVSDTKYVLAGVIGRGLHSFTIEGTFFDSRTSKYDLFMAPEKKEYWVNVYIDRGGHVHTGIVYESKYEATECIPSQPTYIATIKVWEEEI